MKKADILKYFNSHSFAEGKLAIGSFEFYAR